MNPREKISAILISAGIILAFLPLSSKWRIIEKPDVLLSEVLNQETSLTPDQVARFIVNEDSTLNLIDLRNPDEYKASSIPGSVNIPYNEFIIKPDSYLRKDMNNIFYSNGDLLSGYALTIARGLGFNSSFVLKGGLNEWYIQVMNSTFSGQKISARENALFEIRTRARKIFTEVNSLPDSLKSEYLASNRNNAKKLDGGCE